MGQETKKFWGQIYERLAWSDRVKDADEEKARRSSTLFGLRRAKLWGDYGSVLMHGNATRDKASGQLLLERAGPFAPPIFFTLERLAGRCAVVTQSFREQLEGAGLGQLTFKPTVKKHIVDIPWHTWDRNKGLPPERPESGEPGNYIRLGKHSVAAAEAMEDLWELVAPGIPCEVEREELMQSRARGFAQFSFTPKVNHYAGLFTPTEERHLWLLVDEATRLWFEERAGEWVQFDYAVQK
jgi:hypothetical protein